MKYRMITIMFLFAGLNVMMAAGTAKEPNTVAKAADSKIIEETEVAEEPALPEKGSTEYWVVRSEALTEFIPFLTKKRTEVKKIRQMLADYLLKIDKAEDFAGRNMPVSYDAKVYADILRIKEGIEQMNVQIPKERPSWDALVEIAMKFVVYEGYMPTDIEEGEDAAMYIELCKKKEEYGQKVRQDARVILDQAAKMWVYLNSIDKLADFKVYCVDLQLAQEAQKAQEKAQYTQAHREQMITQAQKEQQQKQDDAMARAQFQSSKKQRAYEDRQNRLNVRAANSGIYIY